MVDLKRVPFLYKTTDYITDFLSVLVTITMCACHGLVQFSEPSTKQQSLVLVETEEQLRDAIDSANNSPENDIIYVAPGIYELEGCPEDDDDQNMVGDFDILSGVIEIESENTTFFSAKCRTRIFDVQPGASLIIRGGAFLHNGTFNIDGGTFRARGAHLDIDGVTIEGSKGKSGGAIAVTPSEDEAAITPALILQSSHLQDNQADENGGAVYAEEANWHMTNTTLHSNQAESLGGGAFLIHTSNSSDPFNQMTQMTFRNNQAEQGGAAYIQHLIQPLILNSFFLANHAQSISEARGGAIVAQQNDALQIVGCTFENNSTGAANSTASGGAVEVIESSDIDGDSTHTNQIQDSIFYDNSTVSAHGSQGGAVAIWFSDADLNNNIFESNRATIPEGETALSAISGGALFAGNSRTRVSASTFISNQATDLGSAISTSFGKLWVQDSAFSNNLLLELNQFGAYGTLFSKNSDTFINACEFDTNTGGGVGILAQVSRDIEMYRSRFYQNDATYGGALRFMSNGGTVALSTFEQNRATEGGAVWSNGTIHFNHNNVIDNYAQYGGGLYADSFSAGATHIYGSTYIQNTAQQGAAIHHQRGALSLRLSSFGDQQLLEPTDLIETQAVIRMHGSSLSAHNNSFLPNAYAGVPHIYQNNGTWNLFGNFLAAEVTGRPLKFENSTPHAPPFENYCEESFTSALDLETNTANAFENGRNILDGAASLVGDFGNFGGPTLSYELPPQSPLVDAQHESACVDTEDQRGARRASGLGCDYGAIEYSPSPSFRTILYPTTPVWWSYGNPNADNTAFGAPEGSAPSVYSIFDPNQDNSEQEPAFEPTVLEDIAIDIEPPPLGD